MTGCKIAQLEEIISFLGCLIGVKIPPSKEAEFLMDKVRKRVFHWSNMLLSLQRRIVLVKHILKAILIYHLMALTLNQEGYKRLEQICREFLWGSCEIGHAKVPLLAWSTLA